MCLLNVVKPKNPSGEPGAEELSQLYMKNALLATCIVRNEGEQHGAVVRRWEDVQRFGKVCSDAATKAKQLAQGTFSSSQITTFFSEYFSGAIFDRFTGEPTERIYLEDLDLIETAEEELLEYRA
jgi:hypothetical protein